MTSAAATWSTSAHAATARSTWERTRLAISTRPARKCSISAWKNSLACWVVMRPLYCPPERGMSPHRQHFPGKRDSRVGGGDEPAAGGRGGEPDRAARLLQAAQRREGRARGTAPQRAQGADRGGRRVGLGRPAAARRGQPTLAVAL